MNDNIKISYILTTVVLVSCSISNNKDLTRSLLARSELDQSSIWDTNGDGIEDVERWYRGSSIVYEKLDDNFDGYWDVQGRRHADGSFAVLIKYPNKSYSVNSHYVFYATKEHPRDVSILARRR